MKTPLNKTYLDKYIKIIVASYVIFEKGGHILLLKRENTGYFDGFYSLPAGHLDGNETAKEAAVREVKEEVGLNIKPKDLVLVHTSHRKSPIPVDHERIDLFFKIAKWNGEPSNNEPHKHAEIKWFPLSGLPKKMVPEVKQAITKAYKGEIYGDFGF